MKPRHQKIRCFYLKLVFQFFKVSVSLVVNTIFGLNSWEWCEYKLLYLALINLKRKKIQIFVIAPIFGEAENSNWVRESKLERRPQKFGLWNFRLPKWGRGKKLVPRAQLIQLSFWALRNLTFCWIMYYKRVFCPFVILCLASLRIGLRILILIFKFIKIICFGFFFSRSWFQKFSMCTFLKLF